MKIKQKRAYEKPALRVIELETDQVLIIGCKLSSGGQAPLSPANCINNSCADAGS